MKLDTYSGRIDGGVFKFLDDLRAAPENAREAIGYNTHQLPEPKSSYGKAICDHIKKMQQLDTIKEMRSFEIENLKRLNIEYPDMGLDAVIKSRMYDYEKMNIPGGN